MEGAVATLPPAWARDYIGLPFRLNGRTRDGLDCYGLVCLVSRERFGRALPFHDDIVVGSVRDHAEIAAHFRGRLEGWRRVDADLVEPGDIVSLIIERQPCHVGIMLTRGSFLHIFEGSNAQLGRFGWFWRRDRHVAGFWRWEGGHAV